MKYQIIMLMEFNASNDVEILKKAQEMEYDNSEMYSHCDEIIEIKSSGAKRLVYSQWIEQSLAEKLESQL